MTQYLGWAATAVFVGSYFCAQPERLRRVQMAGALMWVLYGALIGAAPVIAANVLVLGAAAWTARQKRLAPESFPTASDARRTTNEEGVRGASRTS